MNTVLVNDNFFVTSDTWFGREQILQIANRKFSSLEEMNKTLIENWNSVVSKDDFVFHLGNFAWDPSTATEVLSSLNGFIYFLEGNADKSLLQISDNFKNVFIVKDQILEIKNQNLILCHYPLHSWNGSENGVIHIHGHNVYSHKTDLRINNRINACTDHWNYTPIKFSFIKELIKENERKS